MRTKRGDWTRRSIEQDRARFEATQSQGGDGLPGGVRAEELGELDAGDWDGFEPNTWMGE